MFCPKTEHLLWKNIQLFCEFAKHPVNSWNQIHYFAKLFFRLKHPIFFMIHWYKYFVRNCPGFIVRRHHISTPKCLSITRLRVENKSFTNSWNKVYCINKNFVLLKYPNFYYTMVPSFVRNCSEFCKRYEKEEFHMC